MPHPLSILPLPPSYFAATANTRLQYPELEGDLVVDVCVIGGGIAGCSAALDLAERGYRVVLLEAQQIGWGASGRSGGQIIPGFAVDQSKLEQLIGAANARQLWDLSLEAIQLLRDRITRHSIQCDWQSGQMLVAVKPRQFEDLVAWHNELERRYHYSTTRVLSAAELQLVLATKRYCGGLYDSAGGHLHSLNYTLGLAHAAQQAGAQLFSGSPAIKITAGTLPVIRTPKGQVRATHVIVCSNAYLGDLLPQVSHRIMPVSTYIIATAPLGEARAQALISDNSCISDTNFILDYFRRSADHRLLFGGRVNYSGRETLNTEATRQRMLKVFPQLDDVNIDYSWSGLLDITINRAPDFGRVAPNIYYLQGFSGHGIAMTGMAGKLVAEAVAGQAERFDVFSKIKHRNFPGGATLRAPLLALAMLWYRLRDLL